MSDTEPWTLSNFFERFEQILDAIPGFWDDIYVEGIERVVVPEEWRTELLRGVFGGPIPCDIHSLTIYGVPIEFSSALTLAIPFFRCRPLLRYTA